MISFLSSSEIVNVAKPDRNIYVWVVESVVNDSAVNPDGIKTFLANGLSKFPIEGNLVFYKGPKNSLDCSILCIWVFDNFILAEELFSKALQRFETCVLVNNNLCGKCCWNHQQHLMKDLKLLLLHFLLKISTY